MSDRALRTLQRPEPALQVERRAPTPLSGAERDGAAALANDSSSSRRGRSLLGNYYFQLTSTVGSVGSGNGQFANPWGMCLDAAGNILVADNSNHRVQKLDATGAYLSKFGTVGSGNGQFLSPTDVKVDSAGNIYVADFNNFRVQKFDSSFNYISQFGSYGSGNGQFQAPISLCLDASGNIYVMDGMLNRVQKFDPSGNFVWSSGTTGGGDGQLTQAYSCAASASTVYVGDVTSRIQLLSSANGALNQQVYCCSRLSGYIRHVFCGRRIAVCFPVQCRHRTTAGCRRHPACLVRWAAGGRRSHGHCGGAIRWRGALGRGSGRLQQQRDSVVPTHALSQPTTTAETLAATTALSITSAPKPLAPAALAIAPAALAITPTALSIPPTAITIPSATLPITSAALAIAPATLAIAPAALAITPTALPIPPTAITIPSATLPITSAALSIASAALAIASATS
ncbi:hypothetical protein ABPG75_008277 [Micractinium tetrahymenae]